MITIPDLNYTSDVKKFGFFNGWYWRDGGEMIFVQR